jgi:hypothetical protein
MRMIRRIAIWVGPRDLAFFAALFVFVALAYWPSLEHPPRADQWGYLVDTRSDHTFLDTLRHSYSYNRTRLTYPGDTDLFRPLLFAVLAAEKAAFEGRVAAPQALGIVFHCAACVLMLVVLRQIAQIVRPSGEARDGPERFTYATVAFFALNPCVQELVIWAHLHGYLLFLLLVLGSMSCLLRAATDSERTARYLGAAWALALVSAFTYELGQFYALVAGICAGFVALPRFGTLRAVGLVIAFAAISAAYQTTNRIDQQFHRGSYDPENLQPQIVEQIFTPKTTVHTARYGTYTLVQPYFPSLVQSSYSGQRLLIAESVWAWRKQKTFTPMIAVSLAVFAASAVLALAGSRRLAREPSRARLVALGLPVVVSALYAAMTVLGRMNMRPERSILSENSYYAYTALMFGLLAASAAWHAVGGWGESLRKWLAIGLLVLSAAGAEKVWEANTMLASIERVWMLPLRAVQNLVDAHRGEPGFSFEIDYAASDPVPEIHKMRITRIVFDEWMCDPNPRYRVTIRAGKARAVLRE